MQFFARAVVTGFALSLGAALFKKVSKQLGLADEDKDKEAERVRQQDGATDPSLQAQPTTN
ncbi:MAG TPA: hypothetical protein VM513_32280 [Kofleriaceae bacterium]|jgi:hypothetical protein|nr:hypothetical protein [Kofleriaceae bacterium]